MEASSFNVEAISASVFPRAQSLYAGDEFTVVGQLLVRLHGANPCVVTAETSGPAQFHIHSFRVAFYTYDDLI